MSHKNRNPEDRRIKATSPLSRYSLVGRRKKSRRFEEDKNFYVDRYETKYLVLIISILLLCLLDALLTLVLLNHGGIELNPVMAVLIEKDATLFLTVKLTVTAVNLIVLLVHKNFLIFGWLKLRYIMFSLFILYFILILYEVYLYMAYVLK